MPNTRWRRASVDPRRDVPIAADCSGLMPASVRQAITEVQASRIAEISALGFGDPEVVALWYGEGDLPTPGFIGEAAAAALRAGETFYTYKAGLPELRQTIADYLTGLYATPIGSERIAVT